jgi:hypothetical protein
MTDNPTRDTTARFRVGQRVQLTAYGERQRIVQPRAKGRGTVVAYSRRHPLGVKVLPDGYRCAHEYSINFWEPVR